MKQLREFEGHEIRIETDSIRCLYEDATEWWYVAINHQTGIISTSKAFWEQTNKEEMKGIFLHEIGHLETIKDVDMFRYEHDIDYYLRLELIADEYSFSRGGGRGLVKMLRKFSTLSILSFVARGITNNRLLHLERLLLYNL